MAKLPLALPTGSFTGRDGQVANARLINAYVEENGSEAKSPFTIYAAPGLTQWGTGSHVGAYRGALERDKDHMVVVSGSEVLTYSAAGTPAVTATLGDTGRVYMARNRKFTDGLPTPQIAIVTNAGSYYILEDDVLTHVTDTDLPAPTAGVDYLSGFFVYGVEDGRLYASNVENGFAIETDGYEYINAKYSRLRRILVNHGFMYAWTEKSMEIWQTDPTLAAEYFPFSAVNQAIALGISAPHSAAAHSAGNVWVDHAGCVRLGRDGSSQRVSNHAVERAIADLTTAELDDLHGCVYSFHGHETYCLTSDHWTWQYDSVTGKWNERKSYGLERWRPSGHVLFNSADIFGNFSNGNLYRLDPDTYTDAGDHVVMEMWCPQSHAFPDRMIVDALHIDAISGVGITGAIAANQNPHIMVDYSDDGGKNFNGERMLPIGKVGEFTRRVSSYRWGFVAEKGRIWRIRASAAVLRGINQIFIEARKVNA